MKSVREDIGYTKAKPKRYRYNRRPPERIIEARNRELNKIKLMLGEKQ